MPKKAFIEKVDTKEQGLWGGGVVVGEGELGEGVAGKRFGHTESEMLLFQWCCS